VLPADIIKTARQKRDTNRLKYIFDSCTMHTKFHPPLEHQPQHHHHNQIDVLLSKHIKQHLKHRTVRNLDSTKHKKDAS